MARLPTFIIAGAMRSGTTSLNGYLREHPDITVSDPKEVHFFDLFFDEGVDWYLQHFPDSDGATAVGEATPDYVYHPEAVARIAATIPGVKLLLMLRNPLDRAYSHYWHNHSRGRESHSFEDAIAAEPERLLRDPESRRVFSYLDRGRYVSQIERCFGSVPPERVSVQTFDRFQDEPAQVYAETCEFLGVDAGFVPPSLGAALNTYVEFRSPRLRDLAKNLPKPLKRAVGKLNTKHTSPYPPMIAATRQELGEMFAEANRGLGELIGRSVPDWR